jgi:hypothetical protein
MFIRIIIIIIFLTSLLYSCKEHKNTGEVIKINPYEAKDEINLSEIADSVKYIKLQTDSNCVMGRIHDIFIREKYIYALDVSQHIIFVFDKNGKLISKLDKRGKGPDEYLRLGPTFIDDNEEFIEFINYSGKNPNITKYSNISFSLLDNKRSMPRISANSCRREGDTYYFATQQIENKVYGKPTNSGILIVKNGKIEKTLFDKNIITNHSSFCSNIESFTKNDKDELFVSIMYDNTFYQLQNMNAYPIFTVDFGKYSIDNSVGFKPLNEQLQYIKNINGLASFPVLNINNTDIMIFSYYFKQNIKSGMYKRTDLRQYIKLKNSNKIFHTKRIKNDITSFPNDVDLSTYCCNIGHEVWYKDYLVDIILPSDYFSGNETKKTVEGLGEVTIEDNPIIVLMKLKKELKK